MESKASIITPLLLVLLLITPCSSTSRGRFYVKNTDSQIYDIDYRGPETHRYRPPPNRARGRHIAARGRESSPLLTKQNQEQETKDEKELNTKAKHGAAPPPAEAVKQSTPAVPMGWTADGVPLSLIGEPMVQRAQWDSGLFSCLGRNDEFCSSDLEVCLLGSMAPCVLYGSNVERLGSAPGTFTNHCLPYTGLYFIGNSFFGWNCLAPWFSYPARTAIRRKFNLEGSCEALARSCGCCGSLMDDEIQREQCESACDFATHVFCHACALCQEGREVRRRLPHPGFNAQPVLVTIPPSAQTMGRGA